MTKEPLMAKRFLDGTVIFLNSIDMKLRSVSVLRGYLRKRTRTSMTSASPPAFSSSSPSFSSSLLICLQLLPDTTLLHNLLQFHFAHRNKLVCSSFSFNSELFRLLFYVVNNLTLHIGLVFSFMVSLNKTESNLTSKRYNILCL